MGAVCCCLRPEYLDEYVNSNSAVYRNCICFRCFVQQFLSMYTAIFQRGEVHALPSPVHGVTPLASSGLGATSPDNSLPDTFRSPPRPLPYDVDPRYSRLQGGLVLRREKASSHCHEESEPLRSNDCETLGASGKWNGSDSEGGSKVCYSSYTSKMVTSVEAYILSSSEDEDVCPTCLEEYTTENPKIITQCSHHFHLGCIYEWMERSETCPVCGKVASPSHVVLVLSNQCIHLHLFIFGIEPSTDWYTIWLRNVGTLMDSDFCTFPRFVSLTNSPSGFTVNIPKIWFISWVVHTFNCYHLLAGPIWMERGCVRLAGDVRLGHIQSMMNPDMVK